MVIFLACIVIISTISSRDVGAGVRLGEVVFGIVEMMFAFYRHQVVVLEFFLSLQGRKDGKHYWKLVRPAFGGCGL